MNYPFITRMLRYWQTRTHCCGHIVAHDVSWAAQTGKHLLRTQNVSEQNQKHFLCPGHKIGVRNKCCARVKTGKHLCRQQCVRTNVSSFARAFKRNRQETNWKFSKNWAYLIRYAFHPGFKGTFSIHRHRRTVDQTFDEVWIWQTRKTKQVSNPKESRSPRTNSCWTLTL